MPKMHKQNTDVNINIFQRIYRKELFGATVSMKNKQTIVYIIIKMFNMRNDKKLFRTAYLEVEL